jgi:hypothetical protein
MTAILIDVDLVSNSNLPMRMLIININPVPIKITKNSLLLDNVMPNILFITCYREMEIYGNPSFTLIF